MILEDKYRKSNLSITASDNKNLSTNKQVMLYNVLNKYNLLFNGTLRTCKTKPVDIELHPGAET